MKIQKKSAQDLQDEIFRKMSASKRLKIAFELTKFCLRLNRLNHLANGGNQSGKTIT